MTGPDQRKKELFVHYLKITCFSISEIMLNDQYIIKNGFPFLMEITRCFVQSLASSSKVSKKFGDTHFVVFVF